MNKIKCKILSFFYVEVKVVVVVVVVVAVVIKGQISGHWEQGVIGVPRGNRGNKVEQGVTKGKQGVTGVARRNNG